MASNDNVFGAEPPKDASGKVIPLDTEVLYTLDGKTLHGICIKYLTKSKRWETYGYFERGLGFWEGCTDELLLASPDSWERLIEDLRMAVTGSDYSTECYYLDPGNEGCEKCPAKYDQCSRCMLTDIADRIERLMGASNGD